MADSSSWQLRQEWHQMLVNVKTTVEGLLATPSSNVWNTYGGLTRLAADIEHIMQHRLKVTHVPGKVGSGLDYWNFVRGLRWLSPVMAPSVEQLAKYMERSGVKDESQGQGQAWLRHSLMNHSLSAQLQVLVGNRQHLMQHYSEDAYLSQPQYFKVLMLCLQAVEQNRPALLADINPILLTRKGPRKKHLHSRSASLPVNQVSDSVVIQRNNTHDHLAPPTWVSPKAESVLTTSDELALPLSAGSSPDKTAKEALLQVLNKSRDSFDDGDYNFYGVPARKHDPLMNIEINIDANFKLPNRASSHSNLHTDFERSVEKTTTVHKTRPQSCKINSVLDTILNTEEDQSEKGNPGQAEGQGQGQGQGQIQVKDQRSQSLIVKGDKASAEERNKGAEQKKMTHYRSMSDFGVPATSGAVESPADSLSSSLPPKTMEGFTLTGGKDNSSFFPRPSKGQSLISFLSSQDFNTCAELDKENAHFSISEALIAAIEQMKWNQVIRPQQDTEAEHVEGDSDEEIQQLKQRIRIRRRERMKEKARGFPAFSDGRTDSTAASLSPPATCSSTTPSLSDSSMSQDSSSSEDDFHDTEITELDTSHTPETGNLSTLREGGLSLSLGSLYSEADIQRNNETMERVLQRQGSLTEGTGTLTSSYMSAESVAISLIKKFSQKHLPKASELDWLVSEQDAPQALLPLPTSYPVSPDEGENSDLLKGMRTRLRGNLEWAPPRAQIIFNIHPPPKRKVVLAKQSYRCAGCGAKVEPGYMKRYRYCEYLGKFFCPRCHANEMAYIPGRILRKWDFTKYHVSNFARDLLRRIHRDPLFNVKDINPALYRKVRLLDQVRECRQQLYHLKVFLKTCRFGQKLLNRVKSLPVHWSEDAHTYSLEEMIQVKKGEMLPQLKSLVNESVTHTSQCLLCQAKGFICEICNDGADVIFPFELQRVVQCTACRASFHSACFNPDNCPKCARLEARKHRLQTVSPQESPTKDSGVR